MAPLCPVDFSIQRPPPPHRSMSQFDRYEPCNDGKVLVTGKVLFGSKKDVQVTNPPSSNPYGSSDLCKDDWSTSEAQPGYYVHGKVFVVAHPPSVLCQRHKGHREYSLHVIHHENIDGDRLGALLCELKGYSEFRLSKHVINRYDRCGDCCSDDESTKPISSEEVSTMELDSYGDSSLSTYANHKVTSFHELDNNHLHNREWQSLKRKRDLDVFGLCQEEKKTRMEIEEELDEELWGDDSSYGNNCKSHQMKPKKEKEIDQDLYFRPMEGGNQFRLHSSVNETGWYYGAMFCDPVTKRVYAYIYGDVFVLEEQSGEVVSSTVRKKTDFFIDPTSLFKVLPGQTLITSYFRPKRNVL